MNLRSGDRVVHNAQLAERLCVDSAALRAAHARHLATHGNLIPHIFMAEVLARAGVCVLAPDSGPARGELGALLTTLEQAMDGGDRETCSVVCISFIWDGESEPFFAALKPMLGPRLTACVRPGTPGRTSAGYLKAPDEQVDQVAAAG
jgi:hypothetical protein